MSRKLFHNSNIYLSIATLWFDLPSAVSFKLNCQPNCIFIQSKTWEIRICCCCRCFHTKIHKTIQTFPFHKIWTPRWWRITIEHAKLKATWTNQSTWRMQFFLLLLFSFDLCFRVVDRLHSPEYRYNGNAEEKWMENGIFIQVVCFLFALFG